MKLFNKEQRRVLNKMNYQQRKIARTHYYFNDVFGCRLIQFGERIIRIRDPKNFLTNYEKYEISGTPKYLQSVPVRFPKIMA